MQEENSYKHGANSVHEINQKYENLSLDIINKTLKSGAVGAVIGSIGVLAKNKFIDSKTSSKTFMNKLPLNILLITGTTLAGAAYGFMSSATSKKWDDLMAEEDRSIAQNSKTTHASHSQNVLASKDASNDSSLTI